MRRRYVILPFSGTGDTIDSCARASVPYDVWHKQATFTPPRNVIHYDFIKKFIGPGKASHILEIAFDRWGAVANDAGLEGMGFTVVPSVEV